MDAVPDTNEIDKKSVKVKLGIFLTIRCVTTFLSNIPCGYSLHLCQYGRL